MVAKQLVLLSYLKFAHQDASDFIPESYKLQNLLYLACVIIDVMFINYAHVHHYWQASSLFCPYKVNFYQDICEQSSFVGFVWPTN